MNALRAVWVRIAAVMALAAAWTPAAGHDFWIEPTTFYARVGEPVGVSLRVGDGFTGRPLPRDPDRIVRFVSVGPEGEQPLRGRAGANPAGVARFTDSGTRLLAYRGNRAFTEMAPEKFERYLEEKGLDAVLARFREPGGADGGTREAYSRCARSLIRVGEARIAPGPGDRPIGLTLEILADSDPYLMGPGGRIGITVLHEGRALPGVLVTATRRGAEERRMSARTDAGGRIGFTLDEAGVWLIACVHMTDAPAGSGARWESLWASLTFELPSSKSGSP